jgi:hypothetical protein
MTQLKLITAGLTALALVLGVASGVWWVRSTLARAETAEAAVADLTRTNQALEAANQNCNTAAAEQSAIAADALDQRGVLASIMRQGPPAPGPPGAGGPRPHNSTALPASATEASADISSAGMGAGLSPAKGAQLNDAQKIQLIGFYNRFFSDPGSLRVN